MGSGDLIRNFTIYAGFLHYYITFALSFVIIVKGRSNIISSAILISGILSAFIICKSHKDFTQPDYSAVKCVCTACSQTQCEPWSHTITPAVSTYHVSLAKDFSKYTNYVSCESVRIGYTSHTHFITDENPIISVSLSKLHRLNI